MVIERERQPCLAKDSCLLLPVVEAIEARKVRMDLAEKYLEESSSSRCPCAEVFFVEDPCYKELPSHFSTIITLACPFRLEYCSQISGGVRFRVQFNTDYLAPLQNTSRLKILVDDSLFPFQANAGKLYYASRVIPARIEQVIAQ